MDFLQRDVDGHDGFFDGAVVVIIAVRRDIDGKFRNCNGFRATAIGLWIAGRLARRQPRGLRRAFLRLLPMNRQNILFSNVFEHHFSFRIILFQ